MRKRWGESEAVGKHGWRLERERKRRYGKKREEMVAKGGRHGERENGNIRWDEKERERGCGKNSRC